MYMNLKPNQHKRISFKTTTMTSLGFIGRSPPLKFSFPPNLIVCSGPPQLLWPEIFRSPPKIGRGLLPWYCLTNSKVPNLRSPSQVSKTNTSLLLTIW